MQIGSGPVKLRENKVEVKSPNVILIFFSGCGTFKHGIAQGSMIIFP